MRNPKFINAESVDFMQIDKSLRQVTVIFNSGVREVITIQRSEIEAFDQWITGMNRAAHEDAVAAARDFVERADKRSQLRRAA